MSGAIPLGRETALCVVTESTVGTLVVPKSTHTTMIIDSGSFTQQVTQIPSEEKRDSRTRLKPITGRFPPGSFSFSTYFKPSGTAGTVPQDKVLWYCAMGSQTTTTATTVRSTGAKTVTGCTVTNTSALATNVGIRVNNELVWVTTHNAGVIHWQPPVSTAPTTSAAITATVQYKTVTTNMPTCSIWFKKGHTVFAHSGCVINQPEISIAGDEVAKVTWSGEFMKQIFTGTDALSTAITATATNGYTLPVNNAFRFMSGSIIALTSGASVEYCLVTGNPTVSNQLTVTRGYDPGEDSSAPGAYTTGVAITPYFPTIGTSIGTPQVGYKSFMQVNGTNITVNSVTARLNNQAHMLTGEKNNSSWVTAFTTPNFREVTASIVAYFRQEHTEHFSNALNGTARELIIPVGDLTSAGNACGIQMRQVIFNTPDLSGDEEVEETLEAMAYGLDTTNNDEIRVAFV